MPKNKYVNLSAFTASLGGLLFGFDTAVISGAEKTIQELFQLDSFWHGFTIAVALIGTLFGAFLTGKPSDLYGRKKSLGVIAILYFISAIGSALATTWTGFIIYRFIGGLGVGASSVIGPMYIAEISPANIRGKLVATFQFNIVLGILLSYFSNFLIDQWIAVDAWRWMLGVEAIPAIAFLGLIFWIPESPRWLVIKGRVKEVNEIFKNLGNEHPENEIKEIQRSLEIEVHGKNEPLFSSYYKRPVILAILVAVFNQISGINAIMYYAPRIFEMVGFAKQSALLQSISIGFTLLIFTMLGMFLIDKIGRKKLLLIGASGMSVFLGLSSLVLFGHIQGGLSMLISLVGFIVFFAFSQGSVIWVYISEIFPNKARAKGQALGSFTHWLMAAIISWLFPILAEEIPNGGGYAFLLFTVAMLIQFIVVKKYFPETKGKTLEEIQQDMVKKL